MPCGKKSLMRACFRKAKEREGKREGLAYFAKKKKGERQRLYLSCRKQTEGHVIEKTELASLFNGSEIPEGLEGRQERKNATMEGGLDHKGRKSPGGNADNKKKSFLKGKFKGGASRRRMGKSFQCNGEKRLRDRGGRRWWRREKEPRQLRQEGL